MEIRYAAPWHWESYEALLNERLPALLAERLPLTGYRTRSIDAYTVELSITVTGGAGDVTVSYTIPQPVARGIFLRDETPHVVVPIASSENLAEAEIRCAGEQLYDFLAECIGEAPEHLPWDDTLLRRWLPLEEWVGEFLTANAQRHDTTNGIAAITHLRRLYVPSAREVMDPSYFGRTCPFESPEGPNMLFVRSIALGAEVRAGKLVIVDESPVGGLGLTAAMVPCLECDDPNRLLMCVNMMRQWIPPLQPEPALVQTGYEPQEAGIWCGHNLLTAFVSWGLDTYEDGLLMSASCARRLQYEIPIEPGDKFSNRHGTKGVISRILPDEEMPSLPDGTVVDLVYNALGIHARMNFGQLREAVLGRIAHKEGQPIIVPPYPWERCRPGGECDTDTLRVRLRQHDLPEDGMEQLLRDGEPLPFRSTVGYVYWGRTVHIAAKNIFTAVAPEQPCQAQGELEFYAMRDAGAFATLHETFVTRAQANPDASTLAARVAAGPIAQAPPPAPYFTEITRRLAAAGIAVTLADGQLHFAFKAPDDALPLACPVSHPWLPEHRLEQVGRLPELPEYLALEETNTRLWRLRERGAPESLLARGRGDLQHDVAAFFDALLVVHGPTDFLTETRSLLRPFTRVLFSGRTVIVPATNLTLEQVGIPEEMAWTIFGPLVIRELGTEAPVMERSPEAVRALDAVLAKSWVLLNRAPTILPTSLLAFRPVRVPDRALRFHPQACMLMNADFDGDHVAFFLPLTEETQREAAELFSVVGQLRRDPSLLRWLCPSHEAAWGLAWLSRSGEGRGEIRACFGENAPALPDGLLTRAALIELMQSLLPHIGEAQALAIVERLFRLGLSATQASGASIAPLPDACEMALPESEEPSAWTAFAEQYAESLLAAANDEQHPLFPQVLAVISGARGRMSNLQALYCGRLVEDAGVATAIRHGLAHGVTPAEMMALVTPWRKALYNINVESVRNAYGIRQAQSSERFTVLARALRAEQPGIVFAHAASTGEVDPLTDLTSRLFVGL